MSELVQKLRDRKQAIAWARGMDTDYPTKWEPDALCQKAADYIDRLIAALKQANDQAEHFERLWYLTNEDAARFRMLLQQNKHWLGVFACNPDGTPSDSLDHAELTARLDALIAQEPAPGCKTPNVGVAAGPTAQGEA